MKNTWSMQIVLTIFVIAALIQIGTPVDSTIRFRLYKKALHEIMEKNGPFISDYTTTSIGSVDVGDISMVDSVLSIFPQSGSYEDFETELKFIEGKGPEITFNEFQFELSGKVDEKNGLLVGNIEEIFIKLSVKKGDEANESAKDFPEFEIEKFDVKFEEDSIKWTVGEEEKTWDGLKAASLKWLDEAIKAQTIVTKYILNVAQKKMAEYVTSSLDMESFEGTLSFSEIAFFESHLEVSVVTSFLVKNEDGYNTRETQALAANAADDVNAVEIVFDENIINTGLYAAFHTDKDFSLRSILRLDDPSNEYGQMFASILKTQVVGQAWKEIEDQFGEDRNIDAKCSFGKHMFKDLVKDVKPSTVRFLKGSAVDVTLGFGCSVQVENSEGEWENFRSFYAEFYSKLTMELTANDGSKRIKIDGDVTDLRAVRVKIFKKNEAMVAEETALTMMMNMGLSMAKNQAKKLLDIPQLGYPTIKKWTGLTLLRPAIKIYDGFVVISSDLGVKSAEKGCDIMEPPSAEEDEDNENTEDTEDTEDAGDAEMGEITETEDEAEAELNEDL